MTDFTSLFVAEAPAPMAPALTETDRPLAPVVSCQGRRQIVGPNSGVTCLVWFRLGPDGRPRLNDPQVNTYDLDSLAVCMAHRLRLAENPAVWLPEASILRSTHQTR